VLISALAVAASFVLVSFEAHVGQGQLGRILDLGLSLYVLAHACYLPPL
jgi:hypothetical protein